MGGLEASEPCARVRFIAAKKAPSIIILQQGCRETECRWDTVYNRKTICVNPIVRYK